MAEPPSNHAQTVTEIETNRKPQNQSAVNHTENRISYYELQKGDSVNKKYEIVLHPSPYDAQTVLTEEQRKFYLRSTPIVEINDEVEKIAKQLCQKKKEDEEKAYAIFEYIRDNFDMFIPPRNAEHPLF
ncbi:hypothetical protein JQC72_10545 [Polycladomyces sp. WAk]|uniref:Uncharacterized protein n=1 Tax=Polycladomyces zharkentensis TaxID=2807616 RepID=A0ABS2WK96_9BACL|nr:hypothetical protein [Polycladomyces sp. WAk]MBN2909954.1 hypothetical protein [Polycladomyces sp. WAk]